MTITIVVNAYSITISKTRIHPGTTQILLIINVNTRLQSCKLSTPLRMGKSLLAIGVNTDTSNQLINVSTRIQFTQIQSHELSTSLPMGAISLALGVDRTLAINRSSQNSRQQLKFVCFNETKLLSTL